MKRFLLNTSVFILLGAVIYTMITLVLFYNPTLGAKIGYSKSWMKVLQRVEASNRNSNFSTITIGDSVGAQLFTFGDKEGYLTANAGITMAGHYLLMRNAIKNNPEIKKVVLVTIPQALGVRFENEKTTNNFVKPFFTFNKMEFFDDHIVEKINTKAKAKLYQLIPFKFLPFSEVNFNEDKVKQEMNISDWSVLYLIKMFDFCNSKGINFEIISPPVNETIYKENDEWNKIKNQIANSPKLASIFTTYFDHIIYLPESSFKDGKHLSRKFLTENKESTIQKMVESYGVNDLIDL